ncbi:MAG: SAM-dependent methyltransferase [Hydrogenophilaceae bacterium]|nr:SAM-dependent methyltransferase [Hydrogenophilaceae bacterium]
MPLPPPSQEQLQASDRLVRYIQSEIQKSGGWISFARYMERALYSPGLGYYSGGPAKFGGEGDFVTAPQISPLFGRLLARQFAEVLKQTGGGILELGAGTGLLASQILSELRALNVEAKYSILEVSGALRARQQETLREFSPSSQPFSREGSRSEFILWLDSLPEKISGVIFGNEVLDALPVHLIHWTRNGPMERGVGMGETGFCWEDRSIADPLLLESARALNLPDGHISEINLAAPALIKTLGERLESGLILFIDYGFGRSEYYHPQRHMGTLMAHYRHHALDDPFYLPGLCDLTAHVDFTAIADAALDSGMQVCGYTTQANFLLAGGITHLLSETPPDSAANYLPLSTGVQKLLSPAEMGELFKVIGLTRACACPSGFALGDQRHRL